MFLFFVHAKSVNERGGFLHGETKIMSSRLKEEIAKELGFYDVVEREGWGGIKARDAGNMVKRAIELAEQNLADQSAKNNQK